VVVLEEDGGCFVEDLGCIHFRFIFPLGFDLDPRIDWNYRGALVCLSVKKSDRAVRMVGRKNVASGRLYPLGAPIMSSNE
jgi:hypothetical protein